MASAAELMEEVEIDFNEDETLTQSSYWSDCSFGEETLTLAPLSSPETLDLGLDLEEVPTGLRVAGSDFESDPDPEPARYPDLCWDCLHFEEFDPVTMAEEFIEWEEVVDDLEGSEAENAGWEIATVEEEEEEFDLMEPPERARPPAAKLAVASIPSVPVTETDDMCAVCKEGMEGTARRLPCSHRYHGDCILPWLAVQNTCPLCRFELPTDDPEYEGRRSGRYGS